MTRAVRESLAEIKGERQVAREEARIAFREWAASEGWDVRARDGLDDYFEERTYYAWLGWQQGLGLTPGRAPRTVKGGRS